LDDRVVYCHRELHGQLGRDNIRNDQNTSEKKLLSASVGIFEAFCQDIITGCKGKAEEDQKIKIGFLAFNGNSFSAKQNCPHQFSLLCLEAILKDETDQSFLRRLRNMTAISIIFTWNELKNLSSAV